LLDRVTPARIRHEFERVFQEAEPEKALQRLAELGVLARFHPALQMDPWVLSQFAHLRAVYSSDQADVLLRQEPLERLYWGVWSLRLSEEVQLALQTRLALHGKTQELMDGLRLLQENAERLRQPDLRPSQAVESLDKVYPVARALYATLNVDPQITALLEQYAATWRQVRPALDGNDLRVLGLPRGPLYRQILTTLRAARLDGVITNREEEVQLVQQMASRSAES
jgi:tRNA nucleotidyltransferase (CCA-adding enzyme)